MTDNLNEYKNLTKEELVKKWTKTMNEMAGFLKQSKNQEAAIDRKLEILNNENKRTS